METKFKAWNPEKKRMEDEFFMDEWSTPFFIHLDNTLEFLGTWKVLEFSGLIDKNKKRIFEGDILQIKEGGDLSICQIIFENGCFKKHYKSPERDFSTIWDMKFDPVNWEVIGNIYQNPELIK